MYGPEKEPWLAKAKLLKAPAASLTAVPRRIMQPIGQQRALLHQDRPTPGSPVSAPRFQGLVQDCYLDRTGKQAGWS